MSVLSLTTRAQCRHSRWLRGHDNKERKISWHCPFKVWTNPFLCLSCYLFKVITKIDQKYLGHSFIKRDPSRRKNYCKLRGKFYPETLCIIEDIKWSINIKQVKWWKLRFKTCLFFVIKIFEMYSIYIFAEKSKQQYSSRKS